MPWLPARPNKRRVGVRRMASHRERCQRKLINKLLTFRKIAGLMIWSPERSFIPPWSLLFASPIVTRTPTAVDPRTAIRGHVRQLHTLYMILIPRRRRSKKTKWDNGIGGRRNPLKGLDSRKGRSLDFASPGLDSPSPRLGFCFPRAWIFLPYGLDSSSSASRKRRTPRPYGTR